MKNKGAKEIKKKYNTLKINNFQKTIKTAFHR